MNIQALNIKVGDWAVSTAKGDRIFAYCKGKMQPDHAAMVPGLDAKQHHTERIHICALSGINLLHSSVSPRGKS